MDKIQLCTWSIYMFLLHVLKMVVQNQMHVCCFMLSLFGVGASCSQAALLSTCFCAGTWPGVAGLSVQQQLEWNFSR